MITLLVGGARSGKSSLALRLAQRADAAGSPVTYIVTAEPFDDDLAERVQRHRDERPPQWRTIECPVELVDAVASVPTNQFLVVDCLTVWWSNLMVHGVVTDDGDALVGALCGALATRRAAGGVTIVVSNEVGLGVHPESELGRVYRDQLGRLNQAVAAIADTTLLMVAGRALPLGDPMEFFT